MDTKTHIEGFFIEDDKSFQKDKIISLINRCKKFAKLIGRNGMVYIEKKGLRVRIKLNYF